MADVIVKPAFVSGYTDTGDSTKLGPTAWNAARLFSGGADGQVVARSAASPTGAVWVSPSTPGVHAPTHNTGGLDPITNLSAAILTSGVLPDARLSVNVQMKPIAVGDLPASVAIKPVAQADVVNLVSDLALKAPLASPALTGTPTAPTATAGTNTTQLATTAFVQAGLTTAASANHHLRHEPGGADPMAVDAAVNVGSLRTLGTGPLQAAPGDDSRFSNARVPTAHHATHEVGGSDEIVALSAASLTTDTLADARLSANVPLKDTANTFTQTQTINRIVAGTGSNLRLETPPTDNVVILRANARDQITVSGTAVVIADGLTVGTTVIAPGGLSTTPLNASNLSSGTVPPARIVVGAGHLLGRSNTGGAGAMEEIVLGSGLNMIGNVINSTTAEGLAVHAGSHQPGGSDPIQALSADILSTGTLPNPRLNSNVVVVTSLAIGLNPAQSGALRLANTGTIMARNAANTADVELLTLNASNQIFIGGKDVAKLGMDLDYLGNYASGPVYNDGDIVVAADGVAYMCVVDGTTTAPVPWPATVVSTAHHLTHEPGGNDQIQNLNLVTMWGATIYHEAANAVDQRDWSLDSRNDTTFTIRPTTDAGSGTGVEFVFTRAGALTVPGLITASSLTVSGLVTAATGTFSSASPVLRLIDTTQAANLKMFRIENTGQGLYWNAVNDAESASTGQVNMSRTGVLTAPTGLGTTPLNATYITSGTVSDTRLSSNVAIKTSVNTFTGQAGGQAKQYISGPLARLMLVNTDDPVDQRRWLIGTYAQGLYLMASSDDEATGQGQITINRSGNISASGNVIAASMLMVGGTTVGFPALRRSSVGVGMDCVTADQSNWGDFQCREFRTNGHLYQNQNSFLYPGSYSGYAAYQNGQYLATHASYGLYSNTGLYLSYHLKQALGTFMYPGDLANATNGQSTYYLASHPLYGLYSNTSCYFAGGLFVGQGNLYNYVNGAHFYVLNAAQNGWLDTVTIDGSNRMTLFGNGISMRIASPSLGGAIGGGTSSAQSVYVYIDGVGQCRIPVYT